MRTKTAHIGWSFLLILFIQKISIAQPTVSVGSNAYNQHEIIDQAMFYSELLGLDDQIYIRVNFTITLPKAILGTMDYRPIGRDRHQVIIWIDRKAGRSEQMSTLAHELVHASQLIFEEMRRLDTYRVAWKDGNTYDVRQTAYHDRPWEEDAHHRSADLRRSYLDGGF